MTPLQNTRRSPSLVLPAALLGLLMMTLPASSEVRAQEAQPSGAKEPSSTFHADAEIDPIAYALKGYSVHVGVGFEKLRFDLGAFALDFPKFLEPSKGFQTSTHGFGLKLQYFPFAEQHGGFVGIDAILGRNLIEAEGSDAARRELSFSVGAHVGWRFMLVAGLYVTPWIGVTYDPLAEDVRLAGKTYETPAFVPTPTVHIGYRFR